jgi:phosphohistidine phosphatase
MKTLILIRHGKSCWDNNLKDEYRPLKKRAYKDIKLISKEIKSILTEDFKFVSSTAVRAHETAKYFIKRLGLDNDKLELYPELYTFDSHELKAFISNLSDDVDKLVMFGHNPAFTTLASQIGSIFFGNIPTSGFVQIEFENSSWKDCENGETVLHLFPKKLRK